MNANIYTLIQDFDISEQIIRDLLNVHNQSGDFEYSPVVPTVYYSEEQINALCSKDKVKVTKAFANYGTVVKNDKYYSPIWFFYSQVIDYKEADITFENLIYALNVLKNENYGYGYIYPFTFDLIEHKVYIYFNGVVDTFSLCGYDRDFSVPLAYEYFTEKHIELMNSYNYFHDIFIFDKENPYNIIKNDTPYSSHWVYYNKPQAYKEAGITPEELASMLPKYRELGILSKEALISLENKIENYK